MSADRPPVSADRDPVAVDAADVLADPGRWAERPRVIAGEGTSGCRIRWQLAALREACGGPDAWVVVAPDGQLWRHVCDIAPHGMEHYQVVLTPVSPPSVEGDRP